MRKAAAAALIAFALIGCSIIGEPVELAVRSDPFTPYCHTSFTTGTLVDNAEMGTAIIEDADSGGRALPIRWPEGFTARRIGGVIEVLNQDGTVIARTGQHYKFEGGYGDDGWRGCDGVVAQSK